MDYYSGNAVYNFLMEHQDEHHYCWTSRDVWMLVYGNSDLVPRVLCLASQVNEAKYNSGIRSDMENGALAIMNQISMRSNISLIYIRFIENTKIEKLQIWSCEKKMFEEITDSNLKDKFNHLGIAINTSSALKEINSKSSSPYHDWQRNNLGNEVCVSDIDLLRFHEKKVDEFIELKRSYKTIEDWEPYEDDYSNFILISNLANLARIDLSIVYNHRVTTPEFFDDISTLKIFDFNTNNNPKCRFLEYTNMQQFMERKSER